MWQVHPEPYVVRESIPTAGSPLISAQTCVDISARATRQSPGWRHTDNLPADQLGLPLHLIQIVYCGARFGTHGLFSFDTHDYTRCSNPPPAVCSPTPSPPSRLRPMPLYHYH